jgi:hypothetical protein
MWKSSAQVSLLDRQATKPRAIYILHKCRETIKLTMQQTIYQAVKKQTLLHLSCF